LAPAAGRNPGRDAATAYARGSKRNRSALKEQRGSVPPTRPNRQRGVCRGACWQSLAKHQRWPVGDGHKLRVHATPRRCSVSSAACGAAARAGRAPPTTGGSDPPLADPGTWLGPPPGPREPQGAGTSPYRSQTARWAKVAYATAGQGGSILGGVPQSARASSSSASVCCSNCYVRWRSSRLELEYLRMTPRALQTL
jgi:hypothetical protein